MSNIYIQEPPALGKVSLVSYVKIILRRAVMRFYNFLGSSLDQILQTLGLQILSYKLQVLLKTTVGEIDIELWTKEAPKACRNFIQLCMEGYYKGKSNTYIIYFLVPT